MKALIILGCAPLATGKASPRLSARIEKAKEIVRKVKPETVIFSGGARTTPIPEATIMSHLAPELQGREEKESKNTAQNALFSYDLLRNSPVQELHIITSSFHCKRTEWTFRQVFGHKVKKIIVHPAANCYTGTQWIWLPIKEKYTLWRVQKKGL